MTTEQQKQQGDAKVYTEREMVMAQREAFQDGAVHTRSAVDNMGISGVYGNEKLARMARERAKARYTLPKVCRKRTIPITRGLTGREHTMQAVGAEYVSVDGAPPIFVRELVIRLAIFKKPIEQQIADLQAIQDLLKNPEELVDEDA